MNEVELIHRTGQLLGQDGRHWNPDTVRVTALVPDGSSRRFFRLRSPDGESLLAVLPPAAVEVAAGVGQFQPLAAALDLLDQHPGDIGMIRRWRAGQAVDGGRPEHRPARVALGHGEIEQEDREVADRRQRPGTDPAQAQDREARLVGRQAVRIAQRHQFVARPDAPTAKGIFIR